MKKIRVGIVNYLNTRPLVYGMQQLPFSGEIELIGAHPAKLANLLRNNEVDVGLIPVAAIHELPNHYVVGNFCIGTEGEIASVCLFSEVPLEEITSVYLDYQSRSSVALLQWLMKEWWHISPELIYAQDESYRNQIKGTVAGLVIGDRALEQRKVSTYVYDLGTAWKAATHLPFVFAAWISTKELSKNFIERFDAANEEGLHHIDEIVQQLNYTTYDLRKYYRQHLSYHLDDAKREGMRKFLEFTSIP